MRAALAIEGNRKISLLDLSVSGGVSAPIRFWSSSVSRPALCGSACPHVPSVAVRVLRDGIELHSFRFLSWNQIWIFRDVVWVAVGVFFWSAS